MKKINSILGIVLISTALFAKNIDLLPINILLKSMNSKWIEEYFKNHDTSYILRNSLVGTHTNLESSLTKIRIEKYDYLKSNSINDFIIYDSFKTEGNKGILNYHFNLDTKKRYVMTFEKDGFFENRWEFITEEEITIK